MMNDKIKKLNDIINNSESIVFFGGAGVSTESGIPDFRSATGLFNQDCFYKVEEVVSHSFLANNPEFFFEFIFSKMVYKDALPNECHKKLAELEKAGKLTAIITQNVDGLHQKAGSKNVIELHGTINKWHCKHCGKVYDLDNLPPHDPIPYCSCGGIIRPDVVLYQEPLNQEDIKKAVEYISNADTLIIGGTSLVVQPAASLVRYFRGKHLVVMNKSYKDGDVACDVLINDSIGEAFKQVEIK